MGKKGMCSFFCPLHVWPTRTRPGFLLFWLAILKKTGREKSKKREEVVLNSILISHFLSLHVFLSSYLKNGIENKKNTSLLQFHLSLF